MAEWELRPLSLGEILDRTFSLYRRNFLLFLGITAIPHLFTLGINLAQLMFTKTPVRGPRVEEFQSAGVEGGLVALGIIGGILAVIAYVLAYLFSQGATVYAVSDIYLGRTATVGGSLRKMWGQLGNLFGVSLLNGLAIGVATLLLIIPGIYLACRLIVCVPAALLEDLGARDSLDRSMGLTKGNAGRAFVIYLLYFAMLYGIMMLFTIPSAIVAALLASKDLSSLWITMLLIRVGSFVATTVVGPFLLIATSVFYYDLRVRKEAFDLHMMMNPLGTEPARSIIPSVLS
jgi:Membrane domain of glycerophosphoryl diester phosphodiesterase